MSKVMLAADWHGNLPWAEKILKVAAAQDLEEVYQLGDFGLWPGSSGRKYLYRLDRLVEQLGLRLRIVLGNHEDYDRVQYMRENDEGWKYLKAYPRLEFAPRAFVWEHEGVRMATLGGAGSIDRLLRTAGKSWWPQEEITEGDRDQLVSLFEATGWDRVDVMLTHEAPAGLHRPGMGTNASWMTPEVVHYTWVQRVRLREAADALAPRWLAHGHWHSLSHDRLEGVRLSGEDYDCKVLGLDKDDSPNNARIVELEPLLGIAQEQIPDWTLLSTSRKATIAAGPEAHKAPGQFL